ncbi:serine/threonine-protein kinase [Williamsia sterculiae]|uniref:Uncharacterized protein n=1 Tax=Williamsia sterculiae TaxID=1344003 RepID=A0A1N7EP22_9NOCA|nr:hypothetical protein [Williamsia sterculiae]SIR89841.1 hypothetical protein SAMN05445060_1517 [Williamsia sterculiae]
MRWFRRQDDETGQAPVSSAQADLVAAFLQLDQRLSSIAEDADASEALHPDATLRQDFAPLREHCYRVVEEYLELTNRENAHPVDETAFARCSDDIHQAIESLDDFRRRHVGRLETARRELADVPRAAQAARTAADAELGAAVALPEPARSYRSVTRAAEAVDAARVELDAARHPSDVRGATSRLESAATALRTATAAAPTLSEAARRALASVRTRLSAAQTRAAGMPEAYSALLREFSEPCSVDLAGHDRSAAERMAAGERLIARAAALVPGDPDAALDAITEARSELGVADDLVDSVTDRLNELRAVRADPDGPAGRTRFQIRDAQLLAVSRGQVAQWGSVLDAQQDRVDRAGAALQGRHPDYWAYLTELNRISAFVADVVDKMRARR